MLGFSTPELVSERTDAHTQRLWLARNRLRRGLTLLRLIEPAFDLLLHDLSPTLWRDQPGKLELVVEFLKLSVGFLIGDFTVDFCLKQSIGDDVFNEAIDLLLPLPKDHSITPFLPP